MTPVPSRDRVHAWAGDVIVAALACAAFAAAIPGELVLDDLAFLAANPRLEAVTSPLAFFSTRVWDFSNVPGANVPLYRPLFMVALWAGQGVLGGNSAAWHTALILLHAANTVLVGRLVRGVLPDGPPVAAFAAAALFAVHPVHAEAVAWILAFVHPLATLLALLAAHAALAHARGGRPAPLALAALLACAAMLTSEGAFAVPPLLLALDIAVRGRIRPAVALAHASSPAIVLLLRWRALDAGIPAVGGTAELVAAGDFVVGYLRQLVLPWPQHVYLSLPPGGVSGPLGWAVAVAAALGAVFLVRRVPAGSRGVPLLALAWIGFSLLPLAAGALNPRPLFAPRALYLASAGLSILLAWLLREVSGRSPGAVRAGIVLLAVAGLAASNAAAVGWTTNAAVYARAVDADPGSAPLRVKLGELLAERGDATAAEASFRAAAATAARAEDRATALEALGAHLGRSGRLDEAASALRASLAVAPARSSVWVGLGNLAYLRGDARAARDHYLRAVSLDERNYEATANLALACDATGDVGGALRYRAQAESLAASLHGRGGGAR